MMNKSARGRVLYNIVIMLVSVLIASLAVEGLLRLFTIPSYVDLSGHHDLCCEYDSFLGWVKKPNAKIKHITREYDITEHFNSKGFRGPEYPYHKNADEFRILILGDSFAEGYSIEFHNLFSEVLKRELNEQVGSRRNIHFETINTGTGGYSTDQELLLFQNEGHKYKPDLTILMFYENDVWYNTQSNYWRGHKPLYELSNGHLFLTNVPLPPPLTNNSKVRKRAPNVSDLSLLSSIKRQLWRNSYLYRYVVARIKSVSSLHALAIRIGLMTNPTIRKDSTNNKIIAVPEEFAVWKKSRDPEMKHAWEITGALIRELKEQTASAGSNLLVFYIPSRVSIYAKDWRATKRKYGISDEDWNPEEAEVELEAICKGGDIDFLNPIESIRAEARRQEKEGKRLYYSDDSHWNTEGHKYVGRFLAEYISSKYFPGDK